LQAGSKNPPPREEFIFESLLANVSQPPVKDKIAGMLVPSSTDLNANQLTVFSYATLKKHRFETILFLYTAPPIEEEGVTMPLSASIDTKFGTLEVDDDIRERLLGSDTRFRLDDEAHKWSQTAQLNFNLIKYTYKKKTPKILPIAIALSKPEMSKELAVYIVRALAEPGQERKKTLIIFAANLTKGLDRFETDVIDGRLLTNMELMDGNNIMDDAEKVYKGNPFSSSYPDLGPLLTGVFCMNELLASKGYTLIYGNTGQFPLAKKEDMKSAVGMAATAFTFGVVNPLEITADRSQKLFRELEKDFDALLKIARTSIAHALEPSLKSFPKAPKIARKTFPVYVSILKEDRVIGHSGSIDIQGTLEGSLKYHAARAAFNETRNPVLSFQDLDNVIIKLSIPTEPEIVEAHQIVSNRDGVLMNYRNRRNSLLPDDWTRFPHRCVFLSELAAQCGLEPWRWKTEGAVLSTFQAVIARDKSLGEQPPSSSEEPY